MFSIGDLVDKLVIENIKVFNLREKLNGVQESDAEYVRTYDKMMMVVENRARLCTALDDKIDKVVSGKEKNEFLTKVRTYNG